MWCILLLLCTPFAASAQTITGSVSGTITDASGAIVRGATVVVTNVDTGVAVTTTTNGDGIYNVRFLQIGQYKVEAKNKGFNNSGFGPFALEIGQDAKIDVKLTVGSSNTQVDVNGLMTPLLDTADSTLATTLTANTIQNIPLSGRNWSSLSLFVPGAVSTNPSTFGGAGNANSIERNQNGGGASQATVNGNRAEGNNYRLDGIEINETLNNLVGYNPNPDAIGELQVISANAPAEYGNVNGGDVIAVTKAGTNQFHGSLGMFLEDYKLDANTWSNKHFAPGTPFTARNPYTQSQYSATFGGPIIKDKLFFFVDYFGTRYHSGGETTTSVLSAKMRTGDFSELLNPAIMCSSTGGVCPANSQNKLIQLYDPSNNYAPYAANMGVPINNPVVAYLIAHPSIYPEPNLAPGVDSPVTNNYRGPSNTGIHNDQGDVRVDYTPTAKDRISARWLQGTAGDFTSSPLAVTFPGASLYPDKGIAINYVRTINPTLINEFRAGFTRIRWEQGNPADTTGLFGNNGNNVVGIPGTQAFAGFSAMWVTNLTTIGNSALGTDFADNTFQYGDNLTWQRGRHLFKFGVEFTRYQQNNYYPGNDGANGQFVFGNNGSNASGTTVSYTSNPFITGSNVIGAQGYAPADFVLDRAGFVGIGSVAGPTGQRQWRDAYFVQDDWKIRPNLTLNIGLRYEYFQPTYEVNNKEVNVNLANGTLEFAGKVPAGQPATSTVCPTRACYNASYNGFEPRVGFSYQPAPKLVVRGGFGITRAMEGAGANLRITYNPPFQSSLEETGTSASTASTGTSYQVTNGFSANANINASNGGLLRSIAPNLQPQYTNEYSLTTEYQINNFSTFKLGYVGELSQHLIQAANANQLNMPCILNGVVQTNGGATGCSAVDPAPYLALVGQTGTLFETVSEGMANYNALQVQYRQRTHLGLEYTLNYTYARAMTNATGFFGVSGINGPSPYAQNAYNNHAEYGPSGGDVRNAVNGTLVYELPFGRGKVFGTQVNHFVDEAIGGWKVAMTGIVYSGAPVTITANDLAGTNNKASRPNQISNIKVKTHTVNNWFGGLTSGPTGNKYADPLPGQYGNASNGTERAPGYQQYDLSAYKDFTIYHEQKIGFRMDAFNLFNITSLGAPNNNFESNTFGQITSVRSPQRQIQFSAKYQF
jgi:outer membrane receptor protein involved in Fe transport